MNRFLALVLACGGEDGPTVAEATRAAATGSVGAIAGCARLPATAVGACVVAGANAAPLGEVEAACAGLPDGNARGECWFAVAERTLASRSSVTTPDAAGLEAAIAACARAVPFEVDCARHVWQTVRVARPTDEAATLARLRAALPGHATEFVDGASWMVEQGAHADAERAANEQAGAVEGDMLRRRWIRRARGEPVVKAQLCSRSLDASARRTEQDPRFARLTWKRSPGLDAAVLAARAEVCDAEVPPDP